CALVSLLVCAPLILRFIPTRSCAFPFMAGDTEVIYVVRTPLSWWEALHYCRIQYHDLLSVPDNETQGLVATLMRTITLHNKLWIGLRRHRVWGYYYWSDGEPVSYVNWGDGKPGDPLSNMCTLMSPTRNFTWFDVCCETKHSMVRAAIRNDGALY
uniref:C-type lectin domain-containing protein n=1 Tax=Leptobrachium leishanense TaxID=445787 RepID=A0A8C5RAH1_9ANUR